MEKEIPQMTRRDVLKATTCGSIAYLVNATGCQSRDALDSAEQTQNADSPKVHPKEEPLELENEELLTHASIKVGIRSSAEEKEKIRKAVKDALKIVLADPELAEAYGNSAKVELLVVPDIAESLKQIIALAPDQFQHVDADREIGQSAHGDAYTVAIETVSSEGNLIAVQNFMLMNASLVNGENYPQLVVTLDHECRHILLRGKQLSRRNEEIQVYTTGIDRMQRVAEALQKRGGKDAELGKRIISETLPIHRERLETWQRQR